MDLEAKKLNLIAWLTKLEDAALIDALFALKQQKEADCWNDLSHEQKEDIQAGIADIEAGRKVDFDDVVRGLRR